MSVNPAFKSHTTLGSKSYMDSTGHQVDATDRHVWPEQLAWEATLAALAGLLSDPEGGTAGIPELAVKIGRNTAALFTEGGDK